MLSEMMLRIVLSKIKQKLRIINCKFAFLDVSALPPGVGLFLLQNVVMA
jgi:hypothetical protein